MMSHLRTNRGLGLCLAAFMCLFYYFVQLDPSFHRELYDGFSLGFFPTLSIAAVGIFSLVLVFDSFRKDTVPNDEVLSWPILAAVLVIFGGGVAYILLLRTVGYPLLTPIYLISMMVVLGMPARIGTVTAMFVAAALVYVMIRGLGFPLPLGLLAP